MLTANQLVLAGLVCKTPMRKTSPSGIPHCQFVLKHCSQQQEAGFSRKTWCLMPVVISGQQLQTVTQNITAGSQLTVRGFISCHQGRNGMSKLVLHAEQIELMNSGDKPNGALLSSS